MNFKKPGIYFVAAFMLLIFWMFYQSAEAGDMRVTVGPTLLSAQPSDGFFLMLTERWEDKYELGLGYISTQNCRCSNGKQKIKENLFVAANRVVHRGRFEMALGVKWLVESNRVTSSKLNACLRMGWNWTPRVFTGAIHCSNAGAAGPIGGGWNLGQDQVVAAFKLGKAK